MCTRKRKQEDEELVALPSDVSEDEEEYESSGNEKPVVGGSSDEDEDEEAEEDAEDEVEEVEAPVKQPAKQPPNKKRKTAPVSADKVPADEDEVEDDEKNGVDVPDNDGVVIEDVEDSAEEDAIAESAPATKVKEAKRAAAPAENDLE